MADQHCANCVKLGDKQEHTPTGSVVPNAVAGVECYVTGKSSEHAIIYITDVWGIELINHLKAADAYADAGFTVYIPRVLNDSMDQKDPNALSKFMDWLGRNPVANASSIASKVADELAKKYKSVQAVGFCYGCRMVADLVEAKKVKAAVYNHPTFLAVEDVEKLAATGAPLLFNCAASDSIFVPELRSKFEAGLSKTAKFIQYAEGTEHGFTVRGQGEAVQAEAKKAHANAAAFFKTNA